MDSDELGFVPEATPDTERSPASVQEKPTHDDLGFVPEGAQASAATEDLGFVPENNEAVKEEQYGTGIEQAKAGLEGLAQGVAGPLATLAETKLLGVKPEDIAGRAEANPWTHGIAEGAGLIGGAFIPVLGEYSLGSKIAQGAGAAAKAAELGKIGSVALKGAIEAGLFQTSDEATKYILGQSDPEAPVSSALAHIGGASLLGGAGGALLGKAGSKLQEMAEGKASGKAAQFLADFGNRFEFLNKNKDVAGAATEEAQHLFDTVSAATEGGFSLKRNSIEKLTQEIPAEHTAAYVNGLLHTLENTAPELLNDSGFRRELSLWKSRVTPEQNIIGANVKVPTAGDVFEATDDLKKALQGFAKFENRATDPNVAQFSRLAGNLSHNIRTSLENPGAWGEMGKFQKELNGAYSEMQQPLKDFISSATSKEGGEAKVDPAKIASVFRSVVKGKPSVGFRANKISNFFEPAQKLLETIDSLHTAQGLESGLPKVSTNVLSEMLNQDIPKGAKAADWLFGKGPNSIGMAGGHALGTAIGATTGHPYVGYRAGEHLQPILAEGIGRKLTRAGVEGVLKALSSGNPEGVPQAIHYAETIKKGSDKINSAVNNLFTVGGQKYLNNGFSDKERDKLKKFVEDGSLNQQIMNQATPAAPAPQGEEPKGFAHGGEVLAPELKANAKKPVGKAVPKDDHLSAVFPEQSMLLGTAKGRINNYLNSIRPQEIKSKLPFDEHVSDPQHEKSYNRALDIANKPLSVIDHIKNGTLEPEHMAHLSQLYPELTNHLQKKITEKIVDAQMKNEKPPYKVRQSLSLFMGSALDSNLTPQNVQAAQATFLKGQMAQAGGGGKNKKGTSKLSEMDDQHRTSDQARLARQSHVKN